MSDDCCRPHWALLWAGRPMLALRPAEAAGPHRRRGRPLNAFRHAVAPISRGGPLNRQGARRACFSADGVAPASRIGLPCVGRAFTLTWARLGVQGRQWGLAWRLGALLCRLDWATAGGRVLCKIWC
jgi:hypothetical protein